MFLAILGVVVVQSTGLAKCAGDQEEARICHLTACEKEPCTDCTWAEWDSWGPCECSGLQERHRTTKRGTACGKPCVGARVETKSCSPSCIQAKQDCVLGVWGEWTPCDKTCGGGERSRQRSISQELAGGGDICSGVLKDIGTCGGISCLEPTHCIVSEWSEWSGCTKSCGRGQHERHRHITQEAVDGGTGCDEPLGELAGCNEQPCAEEVKCVWSLWVEWGACSATCGGGDRSRSRSIDVAPRNGGRLCEPLDMVEIAACQLRPCHEAVDCQFAEWTNWDACSCSCNGIRARGRHIQRFSEQGGLACSGALKELQPCNTDTCEEGVHALPPADLVDCKLSDWENWTSCTKTCGGGLQTRSRTVAVPPAHGGVLCHYSLQEVRECGREKCEVVETAAPVEEGEIDCKWSQWDEWGACSETCGGGQKMRQRQISQEPNAKGIPCLSQAAMEIAACNTEGCTCQDCIWGAWSDWGACSCTGVMEHHRSIKTHFNHCGRPCVGPKVTTHACKPDCRNHAVNCAWSSWAEWSACSKSCGGGERERSRKQSLHSQFGGQVCEGTLRDIEACGKELCEGAIACAMGTWHSWSRCSASCGKGERYRTREITVHPAYGGASCEGDVSEVEGCTEGDCTGAPVDCRWGRWSSFSACSASCGGGYKTRDRQIAVAPSGNGKLCEPLHKSESVLCNAQECNEDGCVDAQWGPWGKFGECSASCGGGYQFRVRCIDVPGNHCGQGVDGPMTEYRSCNPSRCGDVVLDCAFSDWSAWGACSCSCSGVQDRTRQISVYARQGGIACTGPVKQFEPCNILTCAKGPVQDCELTEWGGWDTCSAECGGGYQFRDRKIKQNASNGGNECDGYLKEIQPCNRHTCGKQVDCVWGPWSEYGACSKHCGGGEQTRYRHIVTAPKDLGLPCAKLDNVEVKACNAVACGVQQYCGWGLWTDWTPCSATCGHGQQIRQRTLRVTASKPTEVLASGSLEQVHTSALDVGDGFSFEHLLIVYVFGVLFTTLVVTSVDYLCYRRPSAHSATALEMEFLQSSNHADD
eukprot:GEMP01007272.1.p1 GENE.GEMP01007272.1~~GEMP01007272.1.p1  ORF type:complete len:1040 (+),score=226.82 GEMP01007272.1:331-3450(+)